MSKKPQPRPAPKPSPKALPPKAPPRPKPRHDQERASPFQKGKGGGSRPGS